MKQIEILGKKGGTDININCNIENNSKIFYNGNLIGYIIEKKKNFFSSEIYCILIIDDYSILSNPNDNIPTEEEGKVEVDLSDNYTYIDKGVYKYNKVDNNFIKEQDTQIILHLDISTDKEDKKKIIGDKDTTIGFFTDFSHLYYYRTNKKNTKFFLSKTYDLTEDICFLFLKFEENSKISFLFGEDNIYGANPIDNITIQNLNNKNELIKKIKNILFKYRGNILQSTTPTKSFSSTLVGEDSKYTFYKIQIQPNMTQQGGGKRKTKKNNNKRTNNKKMTSKRRKRHNKKPSKKTRNNRNNGRK